MALALAASSSSSSSTRSSFLRLCRHVPPRNVVLRLVRSSREETRFRSITSHSQRPVGTTPVNLPIQDDINAEQHADVDKTRSSTPAAYAQLAKAKLSALVVATTAAGFVAAGGPLSEQLCLAGSCVIGTSLCSSSAAAWNQILERDRDAVMKRTLQRPLVTGELSMTQATVAATTWGLMGTGLLALGTDPVTTALGVGNIALYAGLYTYMKPRSIYNTWVGAIVGAIPPVMGFTAAGGSILDLDAIILGSTLYLWQMPHFFALSYMYRADYKRGGFAMVPVLEENGEKTSQLILRYAVYLSAVPFIATWTGVTSSMFALEGVVLNAYALYVANRFRQERTNANARKIFLTSLWYLPSYLVLFLLHSKVWDEEKDRDILRDALSDIIHQTRNFGRQACIHEHVVAKNQQSSSADHRPSEDKNNGTADAAACPVVFAKTTSATGVEAAAAVVVASMQDTDMGTVRVAKSE
jgi:heme o synthase